MKQLPAIFKYVLFLAAGMALFYVAIKQIKWSELIGILQNGNYVIAIPVLFVSVTGYYFRIVRWQSIIYTLHQPAPPRSTLFAALCIGYGVNYVVPRLGELSRCLIIRKHHGVSMEKGIVTIVVERLLDTLVLAMLLAVVLLFYADHMVSFFKQEMLIPWLGSYPWSKVLWAVVLSMVLVLVVFLVLSPKWKHKIWQVLMKVRSVSAALSSPSFWLHTCIIWFCYYLMTYLWIFTFDATSRLSWQDAFILMVVGSIGRSVPVQGGGLGAYHFLISQVALLMGISLVYGNALAVVIHGIQSIFTLCLCLTAYLWLIFKKYDSKESLSTY